MTDEQILQEFVAGDSFRTIGRRHGFSHEQARRVVRKRVRQHVDDLELLIMVAQKEGVELTYPVPGTSGPFADAVVEYVRLMAAELAERGVRCAIRYTPTPDGFALGLVPETTKNEEES